MNVIFGTVDEYAELCRKAKSYDAIFGPVPGVQTLIGISPKRLRTMLDLIARAEVYVVGGLDETWDRTAQARARQWLADVEKFRKQDAKGAGK